MANERILIVDDEPTFVEAFTRTLEAKSYQVIAASSKEQAQELMKAEPGAIVLGTLTPAGQSFAMHQWLKQGRFREKPLMVLDAPYEERSIRGWRKFEGMRLEADAYLTKPVEPAALVPQIQSLLEEAARVPANIRVLVVDDHTMVRDGICAVLSLQKDMVVVGDAVNGQDALDKVLRLKPDVTLMDIVMPVMSGLEATKLIARQHPQTRVLVLTQYDEEENMLVAKEAGAYGFVPKRAASSDLLTGIRTVSRGKFFPAGFGQMSAN